MLKERKHISFNYYLDIQWILPKVAGQDFLRGKVSFDLSNILKGVLIPLHEKVHLHKSQGSSLVGNYATEKSFQSDESLSLKRFFSRTPHLAIMTFPKLAQKNQYLLNEIVTEL